MLSAAGASSRLGKVQRIERIQTRCDGERGRFDITRSNTSIAVAIATGIDPRDGYPTPKLFRFDDAGDLGKGRVRTYAGVQGFGCTLVIYVSGIRVRNTCQEYVS